MLLAQLAEELGHAAVVISTEDDVFLEEAQGRGLKTAEVPAGRLLKRFERKIELALSRDFLETAVQGAKFSRNLDRWLKAEKIDVLVCGAVRPTLLALLSRLRRSVKVVLFAQNSTPFGAIAAASLPMTDVVAVISPACVSTFPSWTHSHVQRKAQDLASGRDLEEFRRPQSSHVEGDVLRVLTVSSITPRKRIHDLIEAVRLSLEADVPLELTVVGGAVGPESETYLQEQQDRVAELDLPVHFAGWQSPVQPYFVKADCFALASENEGLPGVILEAMASGLPVVTTNAGGCADAVVEGQTGHVVEIGDVAGIVDSFRTLLDEPTRSAFGRAGQEHAFSHYSLASFKQRFEATLTSLFE